MGESMLPFEYASLESNENDSKGTRFWTAWALRLHKQDIYIDLNKVTSDLLGRKKK